MSTVQTSEAKNSEKLKTWERRINAARKGHRPSLKNWARDEFATYRYEHFLQLRQPIQYNLHHYRIKNVQRISAYHLSVEQFLNSYEKPSIPLIITNVPEKENWKAHTLQNWTFDNLLSKYKEAYLKCGEDDDGYKITIRFKYFLQYLKHNKDDSPLYIFDSTYGDLNKKNPKSPSPKVTQDILYDYEVPSYFPYDLFSLVGERRRPPYRWFLIGPERSGTTIHIDPLGTSAWNTLLVGRKKWILFPPELSKSFVKGVEMIQKGEDDESINYFVDIYSRMKEKYLKVSNTANLPLEYQEVCAYEFIQEPGETVFVPSGWWHCVLNLTDTIAITQVKLRKFSDFSILI
jgi:histone arginine demethylase JMJD6